MSHSSYSYAQPAPVRQPAPRAHSAAALSRHAHRAAGDYMLVHRGHQVRIGPVLFWIVVGTLVIMALWSFATGTYFAFHDDVLTRLVGRQAELQFAYEDRIAELRAQVDRVTSRQLLDQEQFEQKLNALLQRQALLEQRTSMLSNDGLTTGSIRGQDRLRPSIDRQSQLQGGGLTTVLARVSASLDKVEQRQSATLTGLEQNYDTRTQKIRNVLSDLGLHSLKSPALGGPFKPLKAPRGSATSFDKQLYQVSIARAQYNQYAQTMTAVPVRKPVEGDIDMSSPFGVRLDPFLGRPAVHTGIDLRGDTGEPARATATGKVTIAGWDGGYGNMVELDHGNGLATRYGHLSKILVKPGQLVRIGETVGLIGSTGRSTGPHLHYETRINGEAVNPQKFLNAGMKLGAL